MIQIAQLLSLSTDSLSTHSISTYSNPIIRVELFVVYMLQIGSITYYVKI